MDELVADMDNSLVVPVRNLFSKSQKNSLNKAILPPILEALKKFCKTKIILLPPLGDEEEGASVQSNQSDMTKLTGMPIELGNETTSNRTKETRTESHKRNGREESNDGKNRNKAEEKNKMSNHD
eukprot:12740284-Ditylum_brightwellii.AAC.1